MIRVLPHSTRFKTNPPKPARPGLAQAVAEMAIAIRDWERFQQSKSETKR
jgi:hypothetical protein